MRPHAHALAGLAFAAMCVVLGMAVVQPTADLTPHPLVMQMASNGLAIPAATPDMSGRAGPARLYPDPRISPGAVLPVTREQVCTPGYSKSVRNVSEATKREVFRRYSLEYQPHLAEVDHIASLELGGSNDITNLWVEPYEPRPGAHEKDATEDYLHREVCAGRMTLQEAQRQIVTDWYAAYQRMGKH